MSSRLYRAASFMIAYQWFTTLPSQFLPQELNDGLKSIGRCNLVHILFHDRRISNAFEPDYDLKIIRVE